MQTSVTFKNIDPSDTLGAYISNKLDRFDRFLDNPAEAYVVLSVQKFRHIAEVNIVGDRMTINGKEETDDMYSAIDMVLDKLEAQIKKNKATLKSKRASTKGRKITGDVEAFYRSEEDGDIRVRIRNIDYKPMDVEEAVMQMELVDDNFIVFTNARTDDVNVLYRRKDGDYGLIQPSR